MSILDKRGRLFGKVNIFDGTIVLLLILALVLYLGLIKRTASMRDAFDRELVDLQVSVRVPVEMYNMIKEGDTSVNGYIGFYAAIAKVEKLAGENLTEQKMLVFSGPNLNLWIKVKVYVENDLMIYENRTLTLGSLFPFHGKKYNFTGTIIRIQKMQAG